MNLFRRVLTAFKPVKPQPTKSPDTFIVTMHSGQQCWELDYSKEDLQMEDIVTVKLLPFIGHTGKFILHPKPNCMYEVAVNKRNAIRKFKDKIKVINQQRICKQ